MVTWNDFEKIWASASPLTPYDFLDSNYAKGWDFVGATPPARQMWDAIQKRNDEKFKFLRDNFGTPNMVTTAADMTDTDKIYVYVGSEVGWNNGHWYYYDANTSAWVDGGVYNSTAFVTDTTLTEAGKAADAKAVGDALALKADLAGATFTGNVTANDASFANATLSGTLTVSGATTLADITADDVTANGNLSVVGNATLNGTSTAVTPAVDDNSTKVATTEYVQTEIKPIETDVDIADKRISNIEKLLQGNLYDYDTDDDTAYAKSVPAGAMPYAGLEQIGGKTVVWNQLVKNGNFADGKTGWSCTSAGSITATDNVMTYTISTPSSSTFIQGNVLGTKQSHKYFVHIEAKYNTAATQNTISIYIGSGGYSGYSTYVSISEYNKWKNLSGIFTRDSTGGDDKLTVYPHTENMSASETIEYRNVWCVDLTAMYGVGNEPSTVAEVQQIFPALFYPYSAPTLLSAGVTEVDSKGKNLINEANVYRFIKMKYEGGVFTNTAADTKTTFALILQYYENGSYINTIVAQNTTAIGTTSVTFTATVSCNQLSVGHNGSVQDLKVFFYTDIVAGKTYTLSINVISNIANQVGGIQFNDVMLEESATATNYVPYMTPIQYPIPAEVQALEGYGWSAGSVYNYIDFERKVFVKRVGAVDLGTLEWTYSYTMFVGNIASAGYAQPKAPTDNNTAMNMVCAKYTTNNYNGRTDGSISQSSGNGTYVWDTTAGTDASAFKTAMSGVMLYYELATPVETDISQYITDDNLINVDSGGTLTFPNQNGTDYQIPVPSEETYMIDLQEAINNG